MHPKVDETQGFQFLGHSNWTICSLLGWFFSPKCYNFPDLHTGGSHFLLPQREEESKQQGLEMGKKDSPKSEWDTGVSVLGGSKLDHLQPTKQILFQYFHTILTFLLGAPISYYPRGRRRGSSRGLKWGKGIHPKVNETQGFQYLGDPNWTICSLLKADFVSNIFPPSWSLYWGLTFLINPKRGREKAAGAGNGGKGFTQKWMRHSGFSTWGIQTGPFSTY